MYCNSHQFVIKHSVKFFSHSRDLCDIFGSMIHACTWICDSKAVSIYPRSLRSTRIPSIYPHCLFHSGSYMSKKRARAVWLYDENDDNDLVDAKTYQLTQGGNIRRLEHSPIKKTDSAHSKRAARVPTQSNDFTLSVDPPSIDFDAFLNPECFDVDTSQDTVARKRYPNAVRVLSSIRLYQQA
jgi:hypothetical protein